MNGFHAKAQRTAEAQRTAKKRGAKTLFKKLIILASILVAASFILLGLALWHFMPVIRETIEEQKALNEQRRVEADRVIARRQELEKNPCPFDKAIAYSNNCLAGTGFLVQFKNRILAVTAEHPFEGKELPVSFFQLKLKPDGVKVEALLGSKLLATNDVLVLEVLKRNNDIAPPLLYEPDFILQDGDEILIKGKFESNKAMVQLTNPVGPPYAEEISATVEKPFRAIGYSGAAVIQIATGTVIGVMETADDPMNAKRIGFKLLDLRTLK